MKTIQTSLLVLSMLSTSINIKAQSDIDSNESKFIQPLIISVDLLAPMSIGVEKIFRNNFALKFRYHKSILFPALYSDGFLGPKIFSLQSYMLDCKYYPNGLVKNRFNTYYSIYGKLRDLVVSNYGKESIMNTICGVNAGINNIGRYMSFEFNLGVGMSLYYLQHRGNVSPFDIRANVSYGVPLFHRKYR